MDKLSLESISETIHTIRGKKVMLDFDLASLYDVETKALKQAVKRNMERFPKDFMFILTRRELQSLRSQIVTLNPKIFNLTTPMAFTEQGVAMLSSVLRSQRAIEVNIAIMRTFVEVRNMISKNDEIARKISELEKNSNLKFLQYDEQFKLVMEIIEEMRGEDIEENDRKIGFDTTS